MEVTIWQCFGEKKKSTAAVKMCPFNQYKLFASILEVILNSSGLRNIKTALSPSRWTWWKFQQNENEGCCFLSQCHSKTTVTFAQQKIYAAIFEVTTKDSSQKNTLKCAFVFENYLIKAWCEGECKIYVRVKVMHLWMKFSALKFFSTLWIQVKGVWII